MRETLTQVSRRLSNAARLQANRFVADAREPIANICADPPWLVHCLRDLTDTPCVWFPRRDSPAFYDHLMHECYRGGLKSPRIVQDGLNEATILSLVSTGLGVGWVLGTARWRCPETVVILSVVDLNMPVTLALAWSPLVGQFY